MLEQSEIRNQFLLEKSDICVKELQIASFPNCFECFRQAFTEASFVLKRIDRMTLPPKVIFIPGLLCTAQLFHGQISAIAGIAEFAIGKTTEIDSIEDMAGSILAEHDGMLVPVGLSMGGYVAMEIARQAPERVAGLMVFNSSARPDTEQRKKERQGLIALAGRGRFKGVTRSLLPRLIASQRLDDTSLAEMIFSMAAEIGKDNFILQQKAIMTRRDSRPVLAKLQCPSLFVVGQDDQLTPPSLAEEMADMTAGSRLVILQNVGHLSTLEAVEETSELMINHLKYIF